MIGVVTSVINGCLYCTKHHSAAVNNFWKDDDKITKLENLNFDFSFSKKEKTICEFAISLTKNPSFHENNDETEKLRAINLTDKGILDVVMIVAYFNFVNRIILALDVKLESDNGKGYKY